MNNNKLLKMTELSLESLSLESLSLNDKTLRTLRTLTTDTLFWGIQLNNEIFDNEIIKNQLKLNKQLIKLNQIHSTLLFVGKKSELIETEKPYFSYLLPTELKKIYGKKCKLIIDAYGCSNDALALRVKEIKVIDHNGNFEDNMLSHAVKQHITLALRKGIQAKDSVKSLEEDKIILFDTEIELYGYVKRWNSKNKY